MLPWSVMPTAGCPSAAAAATTSPMRDAPSSIEYSVWRCRWTNESVRAPPPVGHPQALWTGLWMNHMSVITLPQVLRETPGFNHPITRPPSSQQFGGFLSSTGHFSAQQLGGFLSATRRFSAQLLGASWRRVSPSVGGAAA